MNTAQLLWTVFFGSAGFGYFLYGRRQKAAVPSVCGLLLMIFPYFVANTFALVAIGAGLMALPRFIDI